MEKIVRKFKVGGETAVIRYGSGSDLEDVAEIYRDGARDRAIRGWSKRSRVTKKFKSELLSDLVAFRKNQKDSKITLVAEIAGRVVGIILVKRTKGNVVRFAPLWVCYVAVVVKYRRMGVARMLLLSAISETRRLTSAKKIGLRVVKPNPARRLYRECGFNRVKTFKGGGKWQDKTVDSMYMVKQL